MERLAHSRHMWCGALPGRPRHLVITLPAGTCAASSLCPPAAYGRGTARPWASHRNGSSAGHPPRPGWQGNCPELPSLWWRACWACQSSVPAVFPSPQPHRLPSALERGHLLWHSPQCPPSASDTSLPGEIAKGAWLTDKLLLVSSSGDASHF